MQKVDGHLTTTMNTTTQPKTPPELRQESPSAAAMICILADSFYDILRKLRNNELHGAAAAEALEAAAAASEVPLQRSGSLPSALRGKVAASREKEKDAKEEEEQEQEGKVLDNKQVRAVGGPASSAQEEMQRLSDEAAAGYAEQQKLIGGRAEIDKFREDFEVLEKEISLHRSKPSDAWRQDFVMHHLGLEGLVKVGQDIVKSQFDALVHDLASKFEARADIPGVKGAERSNVKVKVRYGGDASQLSDVVRATLIFESTKQGLSKMYEALRHMVFEARLFGTRIRCPLSGPVPKALQRRLHGHPYAYPCARFCVRAADEPRGHHQNKDGGWAPPVRA
eukprot:TRINITY_DN12450_c0_g1_i1.p1 TRINITY_DN12450_c0_g1~~TRINITY_DN12450_c0_g1_i1.p1  ORF type:complete len:349 (+),score=73.38 TRINITY_DN12450_c0_g1_i1:35-1048(+)